MRRKTRAAALRTAALAIGLGALPLRGVRAQTPPVASAGASAAPSAAPSAGANDSAPDAYPVPAHIEMRPVTVPGTGVRAGLSRAEVAAPFEAVASVVLDFARYRELLPRVEQSRVIQRRRGQLDAYFSASIIGGLGTLWARMRFTIARTPGHLRVDGAMVDGNLARFEIRVEATAVAARPGYTMLEVQLLGVPSFFVPEGFLSGVELRWSARGLGAMRDRAEQSARAAAPSASTP